MAEEMKILIFKIGEQSFAADIKGVERILNYEQPTKLPDSEYYLEGVINYQDGILPVISLSKKFGLKSEEDYIKGSIIVSRDNENTLGIVVDSVNEVITLNPSDLEETPNISSNISKRYISGIIKNKNTIILLLKLNELLSSEEKEKIQIVEG